MALNPRIILGSQQPDLVNSFARGQEAGARQGEIQNQNALRGLLREQGPNILAGEQESLNALSRFDPQAALGVQDSRLQIQQREQALVAAKEQAKQRAATVAAGLSAQQREQEAETLDRALAAGTAAQTPEEWDAAMRAFGAEDLVGAFDQRDMAIAAALGLKEALEFNAPPEEPAGIQSLRIRASEAGLEPGTPEFQEFMRTGGRAQTSRTVFGPDGQPILSEGPAAENFKFTEGQSKDNVFVTRAKGALEVLEPVVDNLVSRQNRAAEVVPFGFGRDFQDPDFQVAQQAGNEFLQAILRKDTGAAITEQEQVLYGETYLPQPGDGPEVLEAKRNARARAVDAIEAGMSPLQQVVVDRALIKGAERQSERGQTSGNVQPQAQPQQGAAPQSLDFQSMGIEDLTRIDVTQLNEQQLDAFLEAMQSAGTR
jgi:hypothetical protein